MKSRDKKDRQDQQYLAAALLNARLLQNAGNWRGEQKSAALDNIQKKIPSSRILNQPFLMGVGFSIGKISPMEYAISQGQWEFLQCFINAGKKFSTGALDNGDEWSIYQVAQYYLLNDDKNTSMNFQVMLQLLVQEKAQLNGVTKTEPKIPVAGNKSVCLYQKGESLLHLLLSGGTFGKKLDPNILKWVLKYSWINPSQKNYKGFTPLITAMKAGQNMEIITLLCEAGGLREEDFLEETSPLLVAAMCSPEYLQYLQKWMNIKEMQNIPELIQECFCKTMEKTDLETKSILLDTGHVSLDSIKIRTEHGLLSPLAYTAEVGDVENLKLYMQYYPNLGEDITLLASAVLNKQKAVCELLLESGLLSLSAINLALFLGNLTDNTELLFLIQPYKLRFSESSDEILDLPKVFETLIKGFAKEFLLADDLPRIKMICGLDLVRFYPDLIKTALECKANKCFKYLLTVCDPVCEVGCSLSFVHLAILQKDPFYINTIIQYFGYQRKLESLTRHATVCFKKIANENSELADACKKIWDDCVEKYQYSDAGYTPKFFMSCGSNKYLQDLGFNSSQIKDFRNSIFSSDNEPDKAPDSNKKTLTWFNGLVLDMNALIAFDDCDNKFALICQDECIKAGFSDEIIQKFLNLRLSDTSKHFKKIILDYEACLIAENQAQVHSISSHELKISKIARIITLPVLSDDGSATLYIACKPLLKGLHKPSHTTVLMSSDKEEILVKLPLADSNSCNFKTNI